MNKATFQPGMTRALSAATATSAWRTTSSTETSNSSGELHSGSPVPREATRPNSVSTGPGNTAVTVIPVSRNSMRKPSLKLFT